MHRFFADETGIQNGTACLNEEDSRHALRVLRLDVGDEVELVCEPEHYLAGIAAIEDGSFTYHRYTGSGFERIAVHRAFTPAVLTLTPEDEPFLPPHVSELELGGPRQRTWQRMQVSSGEGFVTITGEYDAAQIYADGQLIADNFYTGVPWLVPAALLYGRDCHLVMSERKNDFYCEA